MDNYTFQDFCGTYFFDHHETLGNTTVPELGECFRRTVLVWTPVLFLWTIMPFQIYFFFTTKSLRLPWTPLLIVKLCLMLILIAVTAVEFVSVAVAAGQRDPAVYPVHYVAPLLLCLAMMTLLVLMVGCRQRGLITSGVIFLSLLLLAICGAPEFRYQIAAASKQRRWVETVQMVCYLIYYPLLVVQLILNAFADRPAQYAAVGKGGEKPCPEMYASFLSRITFSWFTSMAIQGWKRSLTNEDLWALNDDDSSPTLVKRWEKIWHKNMDSYWKKLQAANQRVETASFRTSNEEVRIVDGAARTSAAAAAVKPPQPPSVISAIFYCFWSLFIPATIIKTVADALQFVSPQLLSALIAFVGDKTQPLWKGFAYATLMFVVAMIYSALLHQYFQWMMRLGMNVKTVLISAIFTKCLRLSNSARRKSTVGEIVNLMSADTQRFTDAASYINMLWSSPFQIALSLYFLWQQLGPAVLAGLLLMILLLPLNYYFSTFQRKYQVSQMKFKDDRIKLINEILSGIKVLKLYAWEKSFEKQVMDIRQQELSVLKKSSYFVAMTTSLWTCAPFLVSVVSFATFILADPVNNILTPQRAFVSLALFNILRFPMTVLPMFISFMVQVSVSNKRIKDFLVAEELDQEFVDKSGKQPEAVKIDNGTFAWEKNISGAKPILEDINISVMPGQLVAVVGQVGAGKSSLLSAILGEMEKLKGRVFTKGQIAYVPQLAWIQNLTLKDNVTFSKGFDQTFYNKVIDGCALKSDFSVLPAGDMTEIGEKGINLSGGQKQRVSLARAVYQNADVYLLDDPLSAVDAHVGRHIFDNILSSDGLLKGKTRILVTHGLGYLKKVDNIVVIRDGRISEMGTYRQLLARKGAFAELIETYLEKKATEIEAGDPDVEELEEVLTDLEKFDPSARARLVSQLSQDSAPMSPTTDRSSFQRRLSRQQSIVAALSEKKSPTKGGESPKPGSPQSARQLSRQLTTQSIRGDQLKSQISEIKKAESEGKKEPVIAGKKLIVEEQSETGNVQWKVYKDYLASLGWLRCLVIAVLYGISNGFSVGTNFWLADWSNEGKATNSNATGMDNGIRLGVYTALGVGQTLFILFAALLASYSMVLAGARLHYVLLRNLLRSPMSFFDVTPLGRIVNRLGKDVDTVDNTLPQNLRSWIGCVISVVFTLVVIVISTPIFAVVILPLGLFYYFVQRFYISASRQLKRIESVSRSPIYSHFQETVTGVVSIRAYGAQKRFYDESERRVDINQAAYYPNLVSNRWLAIRLELVGNLIIFFAAVFAVTSRLWGQDTTPGAVGLSVSYALSVTQTLNWAVRMTSDVEANVVSVERIKEYSETPTEAPWETDVKPPPSWPTKGAMELDHYSLRYRPDLELVLKEFSCKVKGGEHVGIVGRTGAGKSSLTLALFRLVEASSGRIIIDDMDISKIGLHDLRSRLTIIPQDPVLFSGTLRMNLDPFERYSDGEVWNALEHSHLKDFVSQMPAKLMSPVTEGGENLSVGQRQLLCLARALLRKTKVLVLDEATSAVDLETENLILKTIRTHFADCTILTIAHRLNTIIDSNRILVLDAGRVAEFDAPESLLNKNTTLFYGMAKDAGLVQ